MREIKCASWVRERNLSRVTRADRDRQRNDKRICSLNLERRERWSSPFLAFNSPEPEISPLSGERVNDNHSFYFPSVVDRSVIGPFAKCMHGSRIARAPSAHLSFSPSSSDSFIPSSPSFPEEEA